MGDVMSELIKKLAEQSGMEWDTHIWCWLANPPHLEFFAELVRQDERLACAALEAELAKPEQEFYPDWDMIKPYHERIKELEAQLAKPEEIKLSLVDIGVDVTPEGTHVVACYNRLDAVQEMFYSQFHPLAKPQQELQMPTKIFAPNLEQILNAAGFYRREQETYAYVKRLAEFIWAKHYKEESPDWTPLPDVLGVLTQIDNMTCGLELAKPEQGEMMQIKDGHLSYLKKPWQGLTDDEINDFDKKLRDNGDYCSLHFAWGISAKLKEKNGAT
jgi:hypothetical protein